MEDTPKVYTCIKACFYRSRLWTIGETLSSLPGEAVPKWFSTKPFKQKPEPPVDDPKTFAEFQKKEAKELLRGVGRGEQAAPSPDDIFG